MPDNTIAGWLISGLHRTAAWARRAARSTLQTANSILIYGARKTAAVVGRAFAILRHVLASILTVYSRVEGWAVVICAEFAVAGWAARQLLVMVALEAAFIYFALRWSRFMWIPALGWGLILFIGFFQAAKSRNAESEVSASSPTWIRTVAVLFKWSFRLAGTLAGLVLTLQAFSGSPSRFPNLIEQWLAELVDEKRAHPLTPLTDSTRTEPAAPVPVQLPGPVGGALAMQEHSEPPAALAAKDDVRESATTPVPPAGPVLDTTNAVSVHRHGVQVHFTQRTESQARAVSDRLRRSGYSVELLQVDRVKGNDRVAFTQEEDSAAALAVYNTIKGMMTLDMSREGEQPQQHEQLPLHVWLRGNPTVAVRPTSHPARDTVTLVEDGSYEFTIQSDRELLIVFTSTSERRTVIIDSSAGDFLVRCYDGSSVVPTKAAFRSATFLHREVTHGSACIARAPVSRALTLRVRL